jgi:hypothetical protein
VILGTVQPNPVAIVVDSNSIYWTNAGDGTVMTVHAARGAPWCRPTRRHIAQGGVASLLCADLGNGHLRWQSVQWIDALDESPRWT